MTRLLAWLERRHAARVRRWNATHKPAVTTLVKAPPPKPQTGYGDGV